jgi:hypothetical protein
MEILGNLAAWSLDGVLQHPGFGFAIEVDVLSKGDFRGLVGQEVEVGLVQSHGCARWTCRHHGGGRAT